MKLFITGITGFVGGAVANYFVDRGHQVSGIGRKLSLPSHVSHQCVYLQHDICTPLDPIEADVVIHAAALASDTACMDEVHKINVEGTRNILMAARNTAHFVYISSSSVYHFLSHPMMENEAGSNFTHLSAYGKSKFLAEKLVIEDKYVPAKTILRPRAVYGKHDQVLLPRLMKLIKGDRLFLPQHLSGKVSLTHIDNLIQAIDLCRLRKPNEPEIFNVADGIVYDLYHVLTTLLPLVAGKTLKVVSVYKPFFNLLVGINNKVKLNRSFNRFAALSLTSTAVLNIEQIIEKKGYDPSFNFNNTYKDIAHWIHKEEGWRTLSRTAL